MKKQFLLLAASVLALAGCSNNDSSLKVGLITLHDENSTYDKNFIDAFKEACAAEGVTPVIKTGVEETAACKDAALELADQGCKLVFADSFNHQSHMLAAAKERTDVQFFHATGTNAKTANQSNYHNAFASIYEGRYLAGIAAGMKLKAMTDAKPSTSHKIGYVGAYTYAEVVSGYTAWYLGVKSVVSDVTMDVQFTGRWYDEAGEKSAAETLIKGGCSVISQHADSWGAPTACQTAGVPNVSYNGSTESRCPDTFIVSSRINWAPYYKLAIDNYKAGKATPTNWCGDFSTGSVELTALGKKAPAEGTQAAIDAAKAKLENGTLKVFDTSTFTVTVDAAKKLNANATVDADKHLTAYNADTDGDNVGDANVIKTANGITYFAESEERSAPYFDVQIDGINLLNTKF